MDQGRDQSPPPVVESRPEDGGEPIDPSVERGCAGGEPLFLTQFELAIGPEHRRHGVAADVALPLEEAADRAQEMEAHRGRRVTPGDRFGQHEHPLEAFELAGNLGFGASEAGLSGRPDPAHGGHRRSVQLRADALSDRLELAPLKLGALPVERHRSWLVAPAQQRIAQRGAQEAHAEDRDERPVALRRRTARRVRVKHQHADRGG